MTLAACNLKHPIGPPTQPGPQVNALKIPRNSPHEGLVSRLDQVKSSRGNYGDLKARLM
jgi:hypothetical protein